MVLSTESPFTMATLPGNSSGNHSIMPDIMLGGCFQDDCQNFNAMACIRNGIMALFVSITGLLCAAKVIRLHSYRHPVIHQFIIFYCATIETIICTVHWILGRYAEFDFAMQYLKLVQFLVVCHFYWTAATRVLRKDYLTTRVLFPVFAIALIYFTVVMVMGIINIKDSWTECMEPYWLMLSSAEFILVQLFMLAGFYITRRLNEISTLDSVRRTQKREIWIVIIFFELSALFGLVYDATLKIVGDEEKGCSGIFLYMQELYSPIFGTFMIVKFLVPIWAMLCVFHPVQATPVDQEDLLPGLNSSEDGPYTSVFSPPNERPKFRQMFSPSGDSPSPRYDTFGPPPPIQPSVRSPIPRVSSVLNPIQEESSAAGRTLSQSS